MGVVVSSILFILLVRPSVRSFVLSSANCVLRCPTGERTHAILSSTDAPSKRAEVAYDFPIQISHFRALKQVVQFDMVSRSSERTSSDFLGFSNCKSTSSEREIVTRQEETRCRFRRTTKDLRRQNRKAWHSSSSKVFVALC